MFMHECLYKAKVLNEQVEMPVRYSSTIATFIHLKME